MKQNEKTPYFKARFQAFGFAFKGIWGLLKTESNFQIQTVFAVLVIVLGFVFQISITEWLVQVLAIGLVLGCEAFNSAVEKLADATHPEWHEKIGKVKDFAAGAVLLATLTAIAVGLIIYIPYVF